MLRHSGDVKGYHSVTDLRAANAVKFFRAGEGSDEELMDWRFSGGFGYEIRARSPWKVSELISQVLAFQFNVTFANIWRPCSV